MSRLDILSLLAKGLVSYAPRVRRVPLDDDYEFTRSRFAGRLPPER